MHRSLLFLPSSRNVTGSRSAMSWSGSLDTAFLSAYFFYMNDPDGMLQSNLSVAVMLAKFRFDVRTHRSSTERTSGGFGPAFGS